jgi:Beta-galactosidase/beta-glucuronidase
MRKSLVILLGMILAIASGVAWAEKPLKDYSFVRGVNYGMMGDQKILERDLGYAKRVNLNSTRIWLSYQGYERDPQGFIDRLRNYIRTSYRLGFTTMPILFNGNMLNPDTLKPEFRPRGDAYVKAIVAAIKDEPGLLMWDVMNEPLTNDYVGHAPADQKQQRIDEITAFIRYYIPLVKKVDPVNAVTVGYEISNQLEPTADLVDVLTFHDYTPLRSTIEAAYKTAEDVSKKYGKPMLNSETACIARSNPYDVVLQIAEEHHTGWYLFNLIIQGYWGEVHGLFYPDGTVRDPAIISAVMGFYRNRNLDTMIRPVPNREGHADKAIKAIEEALKDDPNTFRHTTQSTDKLLDAAEYAANLLEAAEMVPMIVPPSAQIQYWRNQPPEKRDRVAIRAFAYDLGLQLKKWCQLY